MPNRHLLATAVAALALPTLAGTALAEPHRHPGHPGAGHHGHHGHAPGGHGHRRPGHPGAHHDHDHGHGPHRRPHAGAFPHPHAVVVGPHVVFRGGRRVIVRPYPVVLGRPVPVGGPGFAGVPAAGGCSTRRSVSLTPYGWHRFVTVTTCIRP